MYPMDTYILAAISKKTHFLNKEYSTHNNNT